MEARTLLSGPIFTIPNFLSVTRIFLLPPFLFFSIQFQAQPERLDLLLINLGLVILGMVTDFLDGFLARLLKQESPLGQYLDPIGDKIVTTGSFIILVLYYSYPLWMFLYFLFREALGTFGGTYIYLRHGVLGKPNWWGKWGVGIIGVTVFWYIPQPYLNHHLEPGHILLKPWISIYILAFVLTGGIFSYARTYLPLVFLAKRD